MLSDWDIYKSHANVVVGIETVAPIDGPGSLRLGHGVGVTDGTDGTANLVSQGATYTPVGVLRGALAGVFVCPTTSMNFAGVGNYPTLVCLQGARDVSTGAGACYALCLGTIDAGFNRLSLCRFAAGLNHPIPGTGSADLLWDLIFTTVPRGQRITVELEWEASAELSGIRFTVRRGTALNYSDLTVITDLFHPVVPPPSVSLGEGPALVSSPSATCTFACFVDQWRLRS